MSQIEELHSRISAAMERIGAGVEALAMPQEAAPPSEPTGADSDLAAALEDERLANAQLQERLKSIKAKHAAEIEALKAESAEAPVTAAEDGELEQLKADLAEATAKLMAAEAARAELAEAKATLEAEDQSTLLRAEIDALKAELDAVEDVDALKAEIEELRAQASDSAIEDELRTEIAALKAELGQSERVSELSAELEMLRAERVSHGAAMSQLDGDLQRLRKANDQLRKALADLRAANEAGVGEPHLINAAMLAELEALRAQRATDAAEVQAVLSKLGPLLTSANLTEGEDE
ncbi:hypothetical protein KQ247_18220 [Ruegeria pomeroyi]|uniref:WHEP-TRS domain-containing protein n=2 Tax=Ruegeria pomeroyi TaxID=89184 RepID=Q5LSA2_RUEPO|nr:hypothetical protein [Ruegeria pomeroyi]HCE72463.1 hypothetical protein [Ruegeria sp.]AAV95145.1 hypothetical protein SPO1866 [Ruegeria pomeroyi DSS-3]NVK99337.1 hypothetical protein [Ruegeria pomeroyi]NVL00990.1 hypothetical protein [Ruegeria pomeroyi]QWV08718.1 hypothetical protein KQ247_18220 [Ruegeria pomeroyi]